MSEFAVPVGAGAEAEIDADLAAAATALHHDRARCAGLLERAAGWLRGRRDPERLARLDHLRADLLFATGDPAGAARGYRAARRGWLATGNGLHVRRATLGGARVMAAMGEYAELLPVVEKVQTGLEEVENCDERLVTRIHLEVHQLLGVAHPALGRLEAGKRHLDLAEDLAWDLRDLHAVGEISRERGAIFLSTGLLHRAVDELRRARRAFLDAGSEPAASEMLVLLASAMTALGNLGPALAMLDMADAAVVGNAWFAAERDLARAEVLLRSGLADDALQLSRGAESAFIDLGVMERSARAAFVSASALLHLERLDEAETELVLAEQLYRGSGASSSRDTTRLVRARVALRAGDRGACERIATQVIQAGNLGVPRDIDASARILIARVAEDAELAERMLAEAADIASRLSHVALRAELRLGRARHLSRTGRDREHLNELRRALEVVRHRSARGADDLQDTHATLLRESTEELIVALAADGGHSALIEAWQRARVAKRSALTPLIHQARGWQVSAAAPSPEDDAAADGPPELDIDEVLAGLQVAAGRPGEEEEDLPAVPEGPLVDYYVVGPDVLAFVIREGQVHARLLPGAGAESRHLSGAWQQECRLATVVPPSGDSPSLDALAVTLFAPLTDLLTGLGGEPVDVVAHEHLHAVPFDALLDPAGPWRRRLALAGDVPAPALADDISGPPATALVLAVPDNRAPLIALEAVMVAAAMPAAELHVGAAATRQVLAERSPGVDIVHVAAHGTFREGNPLFSAVRLGDGWLRAVDLVDRDLRLDGSVVVLSACGSGLTASRAPRPLGLTWAFLRAGATGVVAALWDIDDEVTLMLMTHFYQRLEAGEHPRTALATARRAVAEKYPHPYYWAPFRYFATA